MLRAPSFSSVLGWRAEQERGLARGAAATPSMDEAALLRSISHYERITCALLTDEPVDLIADLDAARTPIAWRRGKS